MIKALIDKFKNRKIYPNFEDMPETILAMLFVFNGLPAYYWGKVVANPITPEYFNLVNEHGFTLMGVVCGILLSGIWLMAIVHGMVAARCLSLLTSKCLK